MNRTEEAKQAKLFFDKCHDIFVKKAHDYAHDDDCFSNFKKIALMIDVPIEKAFLMFMVVKIARIVELAKKQESAIDESMTDSLMDIANYAGLMSIYLEDQRAQKS